jgi:hypothetical protein
MRSDYDYIIDQAKKDFGILKKWTKVKLMTPEELNDNLKNLLAYHIQKMLENEYSRLLDLLYKVDIAETKVRACFDETRTSKEIAIDLATLYLARMQAKWKTRQEYDAKNIQGDWD